ncbi:MAG: hypothetical protein ACJA2R_000708 [Saprospiraceae bacterium]|jgi:uncharacterized protein YqiB (DUF1249 family)|tara:strand:+ start:420 stop:896 length:477 start_codon:yes stop_codon:yes gene_type:complete
MEGNFSVNIKAKYKVDLRGYMADGDANYVRLMRLFPEIDHTQQRKICIHKTGKHILRLQVIERTPYTTLISLDEEAGEYIPCKKLNTWLKLPLLKLRLYHDAKMAEVVSCDGDWYIHPCYEQLNKNMYSPDEKSQWNKFLSEWLAYCLEFGYDTAAVF